MARSNRRALPIPGRPGAPPRQSSVCLFGALDTKGEEYGYVAQLLREAGCKVIVADTGVLGGPRGAADVTREEVARAAAPTSPAEGRR